MTMDELEGQASQFPIVLAAVTPTVRQMIVLVLYGFCLIAMHAAACLPETRFSPVSSCASWSYFSYVFLLPSLSAF